MQRDALEADSSFIKSTDIAVQSEQPLHALDEVTSAAQIKLEDQMHIEANKGTFHKIKRELGQSRNKNRPPACDYNSYP